MKNPDAKLGDLFPVTAEEVAGRLTAAIESDPQAKGLSGRLRELAVGEAAKRFGELLDVSLVDILSGAWYKYAALVKYADRQKYPKEESFLIPLGKHTIDSRHAPGIEVSIDDVTVLRLNFDINLSLEAKSAVLRVQDGRIREIQPGEMKAEGKIKFGEVVIAERKSRTINLPGSIDLGPGIEIRPHRRSV
jgi:hypothetical protein